jgi:release factor glutamine methyltransferase
MADVESATVAEPRDPLQTRRVTASAPDRRALAARLAGIGCVAADEEADALLARSHDPAWLEAAIARRSDGEPLAWICGTHRFCGLDLRVDPGVYVPRIESEELARRAAALLPHGGRAADLCTGAGAVAAHLAAAVPDATVVGTELDPVAARCAAGNGVPVAIGSLDHPFRSGAFDVVTCVAPYVPTGDLRYLATDVLRHEPRRALDGGHDGLDVVRDVVAGAGRLLRCDGWVVLALGGRQDRDLAPTLAAHGFEEASPWWDEDGDLRGLVARR